MNNERAPIEFDQGLVRSHAARPSPGEHETRGVRFISGQRPAQLAASSRKRISDSIPSEKFFR